MEIQMYKPKTQHEKIKWSISRFNLSRLDTSMSCLNQLQFCHISSVQCD